jgi:flagellar FliJ protein
MAAHRLAAVVRLRERAEKDALERLGAAVLHTARARDALEEARRRAAIDRRGAAEVRSWELAEEDHQLALKAVRTAQEALVLAAQAEEESRGRHLAAYREAEVVRRLAAAREADARSEEEKRERKALDEIASQRALRKQREGG